MRLKEEEISKIIDKVLENLKNKNLITIKASEDDVRRKMVGSFTQNLTQEDKLDEEVEEILKKFQRQIDSGQVDYRKMFMKVKNQLAKDRNFIL